MFIFLLTACGSPPNKEKDVEIDKSQILEKQLLKVKNEFNSNRFPPNKLKKFFFTYEIQGYFEECENSIHFLGFLDDIEKQDNNIIATFVCTIRNESYLDPKVIYFRLKLLNKNADKFLMDAGNLDDIDRLLGIYRNPEYIVVAKINDIEKLRKLEIFGSPLSEEEVEIEIDDTYRYIARGSLIEAVKIPNS